MNSIYTHITYGKLPLFYRGGLERVMLVRTPRDIRTIDIQARMIRMMEVIQDNK